MNVKMPVLEFLNEIAGSGGGVEIAAAGVEPVLLVTAGSLKAILKRLKEDERCRFDFLSSLTAVEYPAYFEVVYHLYSLPLGHRATVKTRVAKDDPQVPSVADLWPTANFQEREAYDLLGVVFTGHPGLTRILLPEGFDGHPLRKDYKLPPRLETR